jgi:hypothetical protein
MCRGDTVIARRKLAGDGSPKGQANWVQPFKPLRFEGFFIEFEAQPQLG